MLNQTVEVFIFQKPSGQYSYFLYLKLLSQTSKNLSYFESIKTMKTKMKLADENSNKGLKDMLMTGHKQRMVHYSRYLLALLLWCE